ncbi:type II toxin-antitoxin system RelE family toxin [Hydromonas duriensis]|uniref:mRNA-degrading endonuclease RelE of RelBE toxin-antitoxin system n=1 Tax=Hydromonas duriensis TaxID=1527608 RepID=A0A4R6Y572_9BURK|nr:type II toxin-antitoxin system RelE/ParE family toxin [Hydromonas duriensis]TDR30243.1 mRNA-degrading endonuclease RelE of RelBE toxin-antitoxin system [Hydromonas duriensis]
MLKIIISKDASLFLDKIPLKHAVQITKKIDLLAQDPNALPTVKLEGFNSLRRAKSGEYRLIYRIENEVLTLHVLKIGKRNGSEVHKNLDHLDDS